MPVFVLSPPRPLHNWCPNRCPPPPTVCAVLCCRCMQAYYSYSVIIVAITLFSIITNVVSAYQYRRRLAALAHYTCQVQVGAQAAGQAGSCIGAICCTLPWAELFLLVLLPTAASFPCSAPAFLRCAARLQVLHNGRITSVDSTDLLPGDVVVLHPGILPCDLALIRCGPWLAGWLAGQQCWSSVLSQSIPVLRGCMCVPKANK